MNGERTWYKDAVIYQIHIKAFHDSDGDGVGDFRGLTEKLDYLQDLGVTALWLLPFYPSPLKDDGYDIADYTDVHPSYGNLRDFRAFLKEGHERGLRVITELVINHTSDQHPWFQRARRAPSGSREREFYVWSDTPDRYPEARIIFKDFEPSNWSWDPVAKAYYWHRFYSHQPDLNFDNPEVREKIFEVLDFWLDMGVDGMRLDAVPYLYEREGTNCENLPETHAFLKQLRRHVDEHYADRMLLAEANQWPEDAVAYFGGGDEAHMAFHFPVMPRLFMAVHMEDRHPIVDILEQTPAIPADAQWAIFLRNHDELTLEMVTDEDRDYMYRVYAHDPRARVNLGIRRRLAPLLGNNRRKIELMNSLLLSLPGTPVIYYGDEIGMGDNIYLGDRDAVRTPMQWSPDRNAGFSRANPQQLYLPVIIDPEYHYESVNVEAQQQNPHSFLWWMKRIIALRKRFRAFSRGTIEFLQPENRKVLVFLRTLGEERVLVVINLSRFVQCVELDLSKFKAMVPVEVFGRTRFPPIGELPYFLTLGPHTFYWFTLEAVEAEAHAGDGARRGERAIPVLASGGRWDDAIRGNASEGLERILPAYIQDRRWFGGKAREVLRAKIVDAVEVPFDDRTAYLTLVRVNYQEGSPDIYQIPLTFAAGDRAAALLRDQPNAVVARLPDQADGDDGVLYDAVYERAFCSILLATIHRRRRFHGVEGRVEAYRTRECGAILNGPEARLDPTVSRAEQSNTSIVYGDRAILKLFRRVDEGINPDLEIMRFLSDRTDFDRIPPLAGALQYRRGRSEPMTLGILQGFVPNEGDAWRYTLDALAEYLERALAQSRDGPEPEVPEGSPANHLGDEVPASAAEMIGGYLGSARLLGQRTAEMHVALSSRSDDPAFAPEPLTAMYRRSLYASMRSRASEVLEMLRRRLPRVPEEAREEARQVLGMRDAILGRMRTVMERKITGMRIRCHGDYHLGQVLYTGKDFYIIDFEGEPARTIGERRLKRSPLRDVAGMLRSFHYASVSALIEGVFRPEDARHIVPWARVWNIWVSVGFLQAYLEAAREAAFLPEADDDLCVLLDLYLLDKALYELAYELNNRPDWVRIPLRGIRRLMEVPTRT